MSILREPIIQTVAYYDLLDYPLTLWELWHYLARFDSNKPPTIQDLRDALQTDPVLKTKTELQSDYVCLAGRSGLIQKRESKQPENLLHYQKSARLIKLLCLCPFVRLLGLSGSIGIYNSTPDSDIDLFTITAPHRIWTARFFTVLLTKLVGLYRRPSSIGGKFCLNHFVSQANLVIDHKNIYTARLFSQLVVAYESVVYRDFQQANLWIRDYIPRYPWLNLPPFPIIKPGWFPKIVKQTVETILNGKLGDLVEAKLRQLQLKHIHQDPRRLEPQAQIVLTDQCLRFHLIAQEPIMLDKFQHQLATLL